MTDDWAEPDPEVRGQEVSLLEVLRRAGEYMDSLQIGGPAFERCLKDTAEAIARAVSKGYGAPDVMDPDQILKRR